MSGKMCGKGVHPWGRVQGVKLWKKLESVLNSWGEENPARA